MAFLTISARRVPLPTTRLCASGAVGLTRSFRVAAAMP
jgi:hypothetical protein